ncbi:MAG: hypothetical protein Unbinned3992contig1000_44 [Prokaryotic dsDNA virus sp.]|nr:MAG: hypothetical protein Unbinned3992contig1000_44 [Prokaryotic dsDNA virus sp.]|tara:strand:+ start:7914 stop:8216 length:303 start_codon:yes stop_codon:yes gene_type:complete
MIYRRTRGSSAGEYYQRLSDKQAARAVRRWKARYVSGAITGQEMCQLMAHRDNPDWLFWRRVLRIRNQDGVREVKCIVVLAPGIRFRLVKRKPSPLKIVT